MFFQHIYDKSLAQASYFIGCQKKGVAAVIDPKRDVDTYLEIAKQKNMKITHIMETHIHADFLAGSRELAALTGAKMYLSDEGGEGWEYQFPHEGLKNGDIMNLGNLKIEVLHTPGHTPESISFLLTDTPASQEPVMLFTGDFVFVGDVGRPDLLEKAAGLVGTQDEGALQMYDSINKFSALPDHIQVWPGHGAGSACGKALGAVPSSTVGYEKIRNWAFQYEKNKDGFVEYLLADQPEPPKYFAKMKELNKEERPLLTEVPKLKRFTSKQLTKALDKGVKLIDARNKTVFAEGFIPGSINIQGNNSFATWAGWFLDYDEPFILLADKSQLEDLTRKLMRIGLDNIAGYIPSTEVYTKTGGKLKKSKVIALKEFKELKQKGTPIVDIRGIAEYNSGHVKGAKNVFVGTIEKNLDQIDKNKKVVIHCQGGDRAAIAYSILVKNGYNKVVNYSAGMNEWVKEGNATV
ncbi:MAG: rhodanese-like domain-containing protein [Saprospiraceae bacterium]